jgi:hypothetical protein
MRITELRMRSEPIRCSSSIPFKQAKFEVNRSMLSNSVLIFVLEPRFHIDYGGSHYDVISRSITRSSTKMSTELLNIDRFTPNLVCLKACEQLHLSYSSFISILVRILCCTRKHENLTFVRSFVFAYYISG